MEPEPIKMTALFDDNEAKELTISYTKAILPYNKKEYTLIIVLNAIAKYNIQKIIFL